MRELKTLQEVVDWRLCLGCGACAPVCPRQVVDLRDIPAEGIRPQVRDPDGCEGCTDCLQACPVVQSDFGVVAEAAGRLGDRAFAKEWGPALEMWEGHATDPEVRFRASSGGALTALGAYCVERLGMYGVLHTGSDPVDPIRNRTRVSRTRDELLAAVGSRYSPASVCDGLGMVEAAPAPCVIIGKPVDIAAVRNVEKLRPGVRKNVGVTLSFYCAETPPTQATHTLLEKMGVASASVASLRYRGYGWPGYFAPTRKGETEPAARQTYAESWAFLQRFRPWATQMWPDGGGELADISCGDPWYEEPDGRNPGFSLVVARTPRGREIVEGAIAAGYLDLKIAERWKLEESQGGLLNKKGSIWGRRLAMRLFGLPVTHFPGLDLFHCWKVLSFGDQLRSTFGTLRRILGRRLYRRRPRDAWTA